MLQQGQDLFISYRRAPRESSSCLAADLARPLQQDWRSHGMVVFDKTAVRSKVTFATDLVDSGLNHCIALLVIVDDAWLDEKNLKRLHASNDWVYFEIRHAIEHRLLILPVVQPARLGDFRRALLPAGIAAIQSAQHNAFVLDAFGSTADNAKAIAKTLKARLPGHARNPSHLRAADRHNRPRTGSADEAQAQLHAPSAPVLMLRWIDTHNDVVQFVFWLCLAGCLFITKVFSSWEHWLSIPAAVCTALCGYAWRLGPRLRAWYLRRLLD